MLLTRLGWPLHPLPLLGVTLASGVLTALAHRPGPDYGLWVSTSAAAHEAVGVVAPVVAFAGAWAGRELSRTDVIFSSAGPRSRARQLVAIVAVLTACAVAGIAAGLLPLVTWTVGTATWGTFDGLVVVLALAGVLLVVAVSVTLGALTQRVAWSLVIAASVALMLWLPATIHRALTVLTPVWAWQPGVWVSANPAAVVYFTAFAGVCVVTCAVVFVARGQSGSRAALVGLSTSVAALVAMPLVWRLDPYVERHVATPVCDVAAGTAVCVHPGNASALRRVVTGVATVNGLLGMPLVDRVTETNASDSSTPRHGELLITVGPGYAAPEAQLALVRQVAGVDACDERFAVVGTPSAQMTTSYAAGATMLTRLGLDDAALDLRLTVADSDVFDEFEALTDEGLARFVQDNRSSLLTCAVAWGDDV